MPSYLQICDKGTGKPVPILEVDKAVCVHLGVPQDKDTHLHWFHSVGLMMAVDMRGIDLRDAIRMAFTDVPDKMDALVAISRFIEDTYKVESWTAVGNLR